MSNQAQTALASWLLEEPVKCTLSREESLKIHPKRHPIKLHYKAGCDAEGRIVGVWARMIGDSGPYASVGGKVLERAAGHGCGPYKIDNIDIEAVAVRTNNPVCGAFRGFGANQFQFAMEGIVDRLADAVGLSAWEIRNRNIVEPGDVWGPGQLMDEGSAGARMSTRELGSGQTTGSRGTQMGAGAVADACRSAVADGCQIGVDYEGEFRVDWTNHMNDDVEHPVVHSTFAYAAQLALLDSESGKIHIASGQVVTEGMLAGVSSRRLRRVLRRSVGVRRGRVLLVVS